MLRADSSEARKPFANAARRSLAGAQVHSGYDFTDTWLGRVGIFATDSAHHDHHHTANQGNFGAEHTDWLFGTMDHYLNVGGT